MMGDHTAVRSCRGVASDSIRSMRARIAILDPPTIRRKRAMRRVVSRSFCKSSTVEESRCVQGVSEGRAEPDRS